MRARFDLAAVGLVMLGLAACAHPTSEQYGTGDVGRIIDTGEGTVVAAKVVDIKGGENSGVGAVAGGALGATGAATVFGGDNSGKLAAGIIGGILGAGAGYLAEQEASGREGIEYVIRTPDGRLVTLVQNRAPEEQPIASGTPVLIQYGRDYTRIVPLSADAGAPAAASEGEGGPVDGPSSGATWDEPAGPQSDQTAAGEADS